MVDVKYDESDETDVAVDSHWGNARTRAHLSLFGGAAEPR